MTLPPLLQLLLVGLAVFLGGCVAAPNVYEVRRLPQRWSVVVVGTGRLLTVIHPLRKGDRGLWIPIDGGWYEAYVHKTGGPHGECELRGVEGTLPVNLGDSGLPIYQRGEDRPVALVIGRRR